MSEQRYCSFCGKTQHEVRKLISGVVAFICDECVGLCREIVDEEVAGSRLASDSRHDSRWRKWAFERAQDIAADSGSVGAKGEWWISAEADRILDWVFPEAEKPQAKEEAVSE